MLSWEQLRPTIETVKWGVILQLNTFRNFAEIRQFNWKLKLSLPIQLNSFLVCLRELQVKSARCQMAQFLTRTLQHIKTQKTHPPQNEKESTTYNASNPQINILTNPNAS